MLRGFKALCFLEVWLKNCEAQNVSWKGRMDVIQYDSIQPKSLGFKIKVSWCILKTPMWIYYMQLLTCQILYYICNQSLDLLKKKNQEFLHNKSMHSQHLYWCKPCDPVEQSSWQPRLSKLRHTGRRSPQQGPQTVEWKATSILAQTTSVTQIRQAQCTGSLSPAAGGGQADLHRMETFSWT